MLQRTFCFLVIFLILAVGLTAAPLVDPQKPHLAGHAFVDNLLVPSPFITTSIRNSLGYGKALDVETPIVDLGDGEIIGLKGDLLFAVLDFEYQYAIKRWIALRVKVRGFARAGTGVQTILSEGVTMVTGFEFGWKVRLHETDRSYLVATLDLINRNATGINIAQFVEDVIDGNPATLVKKTPSTRGALGLSYAWAASDLFGLVVNAGSGYGESFNRKDKDQLFFRAGVAVDADLLARTSVPIGLALGYVYDTFPENGSTAENGLHAVGLRIAYTGKPDFLIALDQSLEFIPSREDRSDVKVTTTTLTLRYYF